MRFVRKARFAFAKKKTKTGHYPTDNTTLTSLATKQDIPILSLILEWRKFSKLRSAYTDSLLKAICPKTHRIHTTFSLTATNTGRLTLQNPNLQSIPIRTSEGEVIREAFLGEGDQQLASFDYSQIELRLLAGMGQITHLLQAFATGEDVHRLTAAYIFKRSPADIDATLRQKAKAVNFAIIYGQNPFGLVQQLQISFRSGCAD